jgi:hypothetical protein
LCYCATQDLDVALQVEAIFKGQRGRAIPASAWPQAKADLDLDLIALVKAQNQSGTTAATASTVGTTANTTAQLPPPPQQQQSDTPRKEQTSGI